MEITFRAYARRDGSRMLYINRSNGVSIGVSADKGFSPYGKDATPGKRNAYQAAVSVIREQGKPFTGDLSKHAETGFSAALKLDNGWVMVGTDCGMIGGMPVDGDGGYLVALGMIVKMGQALAEAEAETV